MNKRNRYGQTTAIICFYCGSPATTKNDAGVTTCLRCKDKKEEVKCPICGMELEVRQGKFGDFFFCWEHGNWSKYRLGKFRRI